MQMDSIYDFDIAELLTFDLSLSTRSQWSVTLYHHTEGQLVLLILQKTGFDRVTWPMLDYFISWCVQFALDARNSLVDARNHRLPSIISNNGKFQRRPFFFGCLLRIQHSFIHRTCSADTAISLIHSATHVGGSLCLFNASEKKKESQFRRTHK